MRCELEETTDKQEASSGNLRRSTAASKLAALAAALLAMLAIACGSGEGSSGNPPPPSAHEWFFVTGLLTGQVGGFSAASGSLEPIPGSFINFSPSFPTPPTLVVVEPTGMFIAVTITNSSG